MPRTSKRDTRSRRSQSRSPKRSQSPRSQSPKRLQSRSQSRDRSRERDTVQPEPSVIQPEPSVMEQEPSVMEQEPSVMEQEERSDSFEEEDSKGLTLSEDDLKDLLNTPFSYGIEFEPSFLQYYDHNQSRRHYDRETIFPVTDDEKKENPTLNVTIEKIHRDEDKEDKLSCEYNLEIDIGPFFTTLGSFLERGHILKEMSDMEASDVPEIEQGLSQFRKYIELDNKTYLDMLAKKRKSEDVDKNVGNFRTEYSDQNTIKTIMDGIKNKKLLSDKYYRDCARNIRADMTYNEIIYAPVMYQNIKGKPQMTIGMSYIFIPILLDHFVNKYGQKIIYFDEELYDEIFYGFMKRRETALSDMSILVLKGFLYVINYVSFMSSIYTSKRAGGKYSYFKSAFYLKPRTNLASSYMHLVKKYPDLNGSIDIIMNVIGNLVNLWRGKLSRAYGVDMPEFVYNGIKGSTKTDKKPSITSFYNYKMQVFTMIGSSNDIMRNIITESNEQDYKCREEDNEMFQTEFIINKYRFYRPVDKTFIKKVLILIQYFTLLKSYMMVYDIIHPVTVIKINIPDKNKIGKDCYMLDGYLYSYIEGRDRILADLMINEGVIQKIAEYPYAGQPPVLEYPIRSDEGRVVCTNDRQEMFEWVSEDSNVIMELRMLDVEKIENLPKSITKVLSELSELFGMLISGISE